MQKAELTQPEPIDFSRHPELISSFKTILGEIETVIDVLQREKIDFEFLLKVNDGLVKDFRLAVSKYPEAQQYYEEYWDELNALESSQELIENPEYIENNRASLIKQFKKVHKCIESPIKAVTQSQKPDFITIEILRGHEQGVRCVCFSPDGETLASSSNDKTVRLWNLSGKELLVLCGHQSRVRSVSFSPDGKTIASASNDKTVRLWNRSGEELQVLRGPVSGVVSVSFSPDGETIACASYDGTVRLWNLSGEELLILRGHESGVWNVSFSPSGETIASASYDGTVRLWNLSGEELQVFRGHKDEVWSVSFSPDGETLVSASEDRTVRLWNLSGKELQVFRGHKLGVRSVSFSPDGETLVSASEDGTVRLWNSSGEELQVLRSHLDKVRSVSFSPDGETIASASSDGTVRLWQRRETNINYVPQGISNDLAVGDDQLSIEDELQAIADVLLLRQLQPPIAVGILGNWGSGKSFGMHLIQERVHEIRCRPVTPAEAWGEGLENDPDREKKLSPYVGHVYQIKFNAWSYAKANLWASLMQEIFAELDRQITLENQLQEAGLDLLSHQNLSEILAKVESGDRQWFLDYLDKEKFNDAQEKDQLQNMVLKTIADSKTEAVQSFEAKQKKLQKTRLNFEQKKKEIITEADTGQHLLIGASINIIEKRIGNPLLDKLREDVKEELKKRDLDPENVPDFKEVVKGIMARKMEDRSQAISWSLFYRWLRKNWRVIAVLIALIGICVGVAYILAYSQKPDLITRIVSMLAPSLPTIVVGQKLVDSFMKWKEEAELALHESQEQIEQAIEQRIETDPELQELQGDINRLEQELVEDSKKLPKAEYVSLAEFVGDRLKPENYSNHLGIMQQVQQDLKNLSDRLLPPDENWGKIKDMFPRGIPRVILYIDDLDRCPPNRVVEVLETVQLLLKTQLFVVVLAVDDRYIARALEEVYSGVLKRRGKPSGIDYLEKIIQIPYRMRPISPDTVEGYLSSQIQVVVPEETLDSTPTQKALPPSQAQQIQPISQASEPDSIQQQSADFAQDVSQFEQSLLPEIPEPEPTETDRLSNLNEINTITAKELELIVNCCKYVDITPRTGKRLINIYKILKIIWQQRTEPTNETKSILFSFLALSGRYPDFMRNLFEEMDTEFQEELGTAETNFDHEELLKKLYPQVPSSDYHAQREWRKFKSDIERMINPNPFVLSKTDFYLALSFCFVGDIGYDPDDFSRDPIMPVQQ